MKKYTYEFIKKFVAENSDCELLSTDFKTTTDKLRFRCKCGIEFQTDFHHFRTQNQRQCKFCGRTKASKSRRLSIEEIESRLESLGCRYLSGEYKNRKSDVTILCSCGHTRTSRLNTILADSFSGLCADCSSERFRGSNRFTIEQVRKDCEKLGVSLQSTAYTSMKDPMVFACKCGREFITTWEIVKYYNKTRCDRCSRRQSFGERTVENWLREHSISYIPQKWFEGCGGPRRLYRFDFYLPDLRTCIEFDGQQHFKIVDFGGTRDREALESELIDTAFRDMAKTKYCESEGLALVRIRFDEVDKIDEILSSKLIPR